MAALTSASPFGAAEAADETTAIKAAITRETRIFFDIFILIETHS
jgi:hypothetical protein